MTYRPSHAVFRSGVLTSFEDADAPGLPDDATLVELPATFWDRPFLWNGEAFVEDVEGARALAWAAVKAKRLAVEEGGCDTPHGVVQTDPDSQRKINGLVTMAMLATQAGAPFLQPFTMRDNSTVDHDAGAMIACGVAVGQHVAACHATARALRASLDAAQSIADVEAVDIAGAAWPVPQGA